MANFLTPPAYKPERTDANVNSDYWAKRLQVFIGIFIGYAGFYLVRKNFSMAIPEMAPFGFEKGELGVVLSMNAIAYALSKFLMGSVSDRSNARVFLPLGLVLASIAMMFMMVPVVAFGPENKGWAIALMAALNFLIGWFGGMGWPPCGRVMTHWFSVSERGTWMAIWNCAHNVGGALIGPMAAYGAIWFGSWFFGQNSELYFLAGTYIFPSTVAIFIALIAYILIRDTPQSCGLPSVEKWRNDYPENYSEQAEKVLSTKEILFQHVLNNKLLWYIAIANAFVYMIRYGCLDWAPTLLKEQYGFDIKEAGWAYFAYEAAAIPGTLICGWLSDAVFKGRRAMPTAIFMVIVALALGVYWYSSTTEHIMLAVLSLIAIGFFIYGPVMLIGVQALDLAPKNAAGTAAGLTGFFGYFFGTALLANMLIGFVAEHAGWNWTFILLLGACALSVLFMSLTFKAEKYLAEKR